MHKIILVVFLNFFTCLNASQINKESFSNFDSLAYFCNNCLVEKDQLKKCSKCKVAHYCDDKCQKQIWNLCYFI
jgi:hypothetical protein